MQFAKKEIKLCLVADDIIADIIYPKKSTKKIPRTKKQGCSRITGYKINTNKPVAFLRAKSERTEVKLKTQYPVKVFLSK